MSLPFVPFAQPPRKQWKINSERRLDKEIIEGLEDDEYDDNDEDGSFDDDLLDDYDGWTQSMDSIQTDEFSAEEPVDEYELLQQNIQYLLDNPLLAYKTSDLPKKKPIINIKIRKNALTKVLANPWKSFQEWRQAERARRMHYIIREYERRVYEYDEMQKQKLAEEVADDERYCSSAANHFVYINSFSF
jgi:hypothetical protein